ncbi:zinc finger BED domain-containing protein RICESLEEPER 2-like [Cynara cardunculus var. scolymus]|uniref:zinc finger BED domain-containing protein RICESLEEPER 2-like n=1 Tax=Cynara cardunculus var. scolymus TaxID=59895 RepID=UPI000D62CFA5|nr:zinc finger BED domain-containing protein RICESLEEPER 2-like [Cynara cardunculus var. scolymus]
MDNLNTRVVDVEKFTRDLKMEPSENENILGDEMEGNKEQETTGDDTYESVSMPIGTNTNTSNEQPQKSFIYVPSPHTAEALSQAMMKCLLDWNVDNKLSTLTLDNCSTNDAIIDKLLVGRAIENVRDSVAFWTNSPKRVQEFKLCARQLSVNCEKELVLDCKTRWNSVYLMLNVVLEYKDVFSRLSKKERSYVCLPSEDEWAMTSIVCEKLKLFYRVTEKFSKTLYPTSNIFFSLICEIKVSLLSWKNPDHDAIRQMASLMLIKFNKYWSVIHEVMSVAIVLDLRYKLKLINYFFPKIYGGEAKKYKKKYADKLSQKGQSTASSLDVDDFTTDRPTWEMDFESIMCDDDVMKTSELDDYLAEKLSPNEEGFDILMWRKCNGSKFPMLQRIAKDVLAIPISMVASESAFNMSDKKHGEPQAFDETVTYDADVE